MTITLLQYRDGQIETSTITKLMLSSVLLSKGSVYFILHGSLLFGGGRGEDVGIVKVFVEQLYRCFYEVFAYLLMQGQLSTHLIPPIKLKLKLNQTLSKSLIQISLILLLMNAQNASGYPAQYYQNMDKSKTPSPTKPQLVVHINHDHKSQQGRMEQKYGSLKLQELKEQEIQKSLESIWKDIKQYQDVVNRKIGKFYSQLRPMPHQTEKSVDNSMQTLKNQIEQSKKLLQFQNSQINQIQEQQKQYDSRQNIEFAIPIQISQTKKGIFELQKFIHVAKIRQKKKSEDLVKVDKLNQKQFQKTAMLRTNLQVAMLYQINLNQRQMKIDDHMYQFNCKIQNLDLKLQNLDKIVQEKHIPVSSNKNLLILKNKKIRLSKLRDDQQRKYLLLKHTYQKGQEFINRDKQIIKNQLKQKERRLIQLEKQIYNISQKDQKHLEDKNIEKRLRKSISFNYASTLLKMKDKKAVTDIQQNKSQIHSSLEKSTLLSKPNFKVKRYKKMIGNAKPLDLTGDETENGFKQEILLPVTQSKNPESQLQLRKSDVARNRSLISKGEIKRLGNTMEESFDLISDN